MILEKELYSKNSIFRSTAILLRGFWAMSFYFLLNFLGKKPDFSFPRSERKQLKGLPYLLVNEKNQLACTSCGLCQDICPPACLHVLTKGNRDSSYGSSPEGFSFEVLKCMFCGLCEEVCPEDAIRMGPEKVLAGHAEQGWVWDHHFLAFRLTLNNGQGVKVGEPHPGI